MALFYHLILILFYVLLQVLIFNKLHLLGGIALIYIYGMIKLPVQLPRWLQITLGFCIGLLVDLFCNTLGMHALIASTYMWLRLPILHSFIVSDDIKSGCPGLKMLSLSVFSRFVLVSVTIYCVLLYVTEACSAFNMVDMIFKIIVSTLLTTLLVLVIEFSINHQ